MWLARHLRWLSGNAIGHRRGKIVPQRAYAAARWRPLRVATDSGLPYLGFGGFPRRRVSSVYVTVRELTCHYRAKDSLRACGHLEPSLETCNVVMHRGWAQA